MTSTLHGVYHSKGGARRFHLREGQRNFTGADGVLKDPPPAAAVIGEQGYDSNKIPKMLARQGIPPRRSRKQPVHAMGERRDGGGIRDVILSKVNPGEAADGAGVNQGIFHGVVGQGPPVLHQVNP